MTPSLDNMRMHQKLDNVYQVFNQKINDEKKYLSDLMDEKIKSKEVILETKIKEIHEYMLNLHSEVDTLENRLSDKVNLFNPHPFNVYICYRCKNLTRNTNQKLNLL